MLLRDVIERGERDSASRLALTYRDAAMTYGDLAAGVRAMAAALDAEGVGVGDRVAIVLPNCPQFVMAYFACAWIGAVSVPLNPLWKARELAFVWDDCKAAVVVTAAPLLPAVRDARKIARGVRSVLIAGGADNLEPGEAVLEHAMARSAGAAPPHPDMDEHDPTFVVYTSGTTGIPKGALLSHRNLLFNCSQALPVVHLTAADNFLCVLPLFHCFAATVCMMLPLTMGAAITLMDQFAPARVLEQVQRGGCTLFAGVPAMFGVLLSVPAPERGAFASVRIACSSASPLPVPVWRQFEEAYGIPIIEGYGMTECSPIVCLNPVEGRRYGTVGPAVPGCEVAILDPAGASVATGEVGEVCVRGENVMLGYLNRPEETAAAMRGGWYHTGDLGTLDADGYVAIVDRLKDMVIVGGLKVYPSEVEVVLASHDGVADVTVVGVPDAMRGEQVVAVVVPRPGMAPTGRELMRHCRERLANYKVPRTVVFRPALPRTATGKVMKNVMRDELVASSAAAGDEPED